MFMPGLGSGLPVTGSPEFEQFCTSGFPAGTQAFKSLASTSSATPALALNLSIKALCANGKAQACESWRPQGGFRPALFPRRGFGFDRSRLVNARRGLAAEPEAEAPAPLPGRQEPS